MADIRPFRGVHYNQRLAGDLSQVICPPFDIIAPSLQQELYHRSQYNFVRLEHGRELPQDTVTDNRYTRSAATIEQWLKEGVLEIDQVPAIYLHDHHFTYQGMEYRRRGIVACVRLEGWDKKVVRPHEGTLARPKDERVNMLRILRANTSPIMALFADQGRQVTHLLAEQEFKKPLISSTSVAGEKHQVWAISESPVLDQLASSLAGQPLYIADGHHRYESALAYQREQSVLSPGLSGDEAYNFTLMTLVDIADPGLVVLPPHRLVRGIPRPVLSEFLTNLEALFTVEELAPDEPGVWQRVDGVLAGRAEQVRLVLFGPGGRLFLLRLRDLTAASRMMPYFHSELYKSLDVSIVDHVILEKLLGMDSGPEEDRIAFSYDREDTVSRVQDQEYQLAFLISPVSVDMVKAIADAGDRLPRKSTYFYPKLPSGLVFYRLE